MMDTNALERMSENDLTEMYHANLELWERADREGKVGLAEYFDNRLDEIEVIWMDMGKDLQVLK